MITATLPILAALALSGSKAPALDSGVNITRWFCYLGANERDEHFRTYLTLADYATFKRLSISFVRLCISPDVIYQHGAPDQHVLGFIDQAVSDLNSRGIQVIWDLHDNGQLKLDSDAGDKHGFLNFWKEVAQHYSGKRESNLIFELLNEPVFQKNPDDWYQLQKEAVSAIREVDPKRTIMVSSTSWSSIDTLLKMSTLDQSKLIYTFHCYDPFFFTHQGAEWVGEYPGKFSHIPFPSSPETVEAILGENDQKYHPALEDYGQHRYNAAYLKERIDSAADWGRKAKVRVLLGEFGAYPKVSPPDSRSRWFIGIRQAIQNAKVPYAIWGYDDGLGLGRRVESDGSLYLDPVTLANFYDRK